ncbi:hypothetical protein ACWDUX_30095 [Streptomyces sp. NPDC003444]
MTILHTQRTYVRPAKSKLPEFTALLSHDDEPDSESVFTLATQAGGKATVTLTSDDLKSLSDLLFEASTAKSRLY